MVVIEMSKKIKKLNDNELNVSGGGVIGSIAKAPFKLAACVGLSVAGAAVGALGGASLGVLGAVELVYGKKKIIDKSIDKSKLSQPQKTDDQLNELITQIK